MDKDVGRVGVAETGSREPSPSGLGPAGFDPARWALLRADLALLAFDPEGISSDMRRANVYCHQEDARKRLVSLVPNMLRYIEARLAALVPDDIWTRPTDFAPEWIDAANLLQDVRLILRDSDGSGEAGQTAEQAGPKATARAEGIAQNLPSEPTS